MPRTARIRPAIALIAFAATSLVAIPMADAGGGPPPAGLFDFEAAYINCVDDEVDEPGIDGDALVRVRVTNNSAQDVVVSDGTWRLTQDGSTLQIGDFITPADLDIGATWEQVVRILGGTGPAAYTATVDVTGPGGTTNLTLSSALDVPGDCPQPDDTTTTSSSEPAPSTAADTATARPRFTG